MYPMSRSPWRNASTNLPGFWHRRSRTHIRSEEFSPAAAPEQKSKAARVGRKELHQKCFFSLFSSYASLLTFHPSRLSDYLICSRQHIRWNRQADLLGCREIHYESELVARPTGTSTGLVTFLSLISVVALFVGCATMAVFLSRLLIWNCST